MRSAIGVALALGLVAAAACASRPVDGPRPPPVTATQAVDHPGLGHVVAFTAGICSGAAPEGDDGFDALVALGFRTVLSVDGARPDLPRAHARGLRYVHLPIGYDGIDEARGLAIARAVRDLPGPIYIHCHHGRHRSAAAAGVAGVTLGHLTPDQAGARMAVSGTSPSYPGLHRCVALARPAARRVDTASADFPETWASTGTVDSMVAIDDAFDRLKACAQAGWTAPLDHADLVPAAEAGRLADLLRDLAAHDESLGRGDAFRRDLREAQEHASRLETALVDGAGAAEASRRLRLVAESCTACHARHRD
ncbi:MAG TPA: hypothetical protein VEL07_05855 [Planctomycetota bacterium]|nr:hypothetical protein [Planctomycetota bacterium]